MEKEIRERNGCISFWLWIAIIANIALSIFYAVSMFNVGTGEMALGFGLCSILGVVNILSAILLLRWNKVGFYMMVVSSIMAIIINIFVLKMEPVTMVGSLFAIIIWWAILQMKKNGVSAWSQLQSGWDGKHCRHLYQLFAAISAVLFILTMIAFGNAGRGDNDNYDDDIVAIADDEVMTEDEVEEIVIINSVASPEKDVIVVEEPVKTKPQEQQTLKEESSDNKEPKSDKRANPAPASSDSEDYDKHERFLKEAIREGNKSFPQKAAEGMIMKRCYLDGDYVMYLAECDEDLYDMELLNMNKGDIKQGIKDMVRQNNDPQISYLVRLCIKAHKGIGFKYQGDTSGKSCIVRVPYSELKNL